MPSISRSLANTIVAAHHLLGLAESKKLYPNDVDLDEAAELRDVLMLELSVGIENPEFEEARKLIKEKKFDAFEHEEVILMVFMIGLARFSGEKNLPDIKLEETLGEAYQNISPSLEKTVEKIQEILIFSCRFPDPTASAEFVQVPRFFFLLTKYWSLYRDIIVHHGTAPIGYTPHPLLRFIVNLKERIETCLDRVGDVELSSAINEVLEMPCDQDLNMAYEEWVQPRIEAASEAIERSRLCFKRQSFSLTKAERLFVHITEIALENLRDRTSKDWQKMLARVDKIRTSTGPSEKKDVLPVSCFESIGRVENVLRQLIQMQYQERFSENWLKELEQTMGVEVYNAAIETMKQRKQVDVAELLHYTNLSDLNLIIVKSWELFLPVFKGQKKDFHRNMAIILKGRTEEAHHRPEHLWPEIEKQRVRVACHDILIRLKMS
jgi:hypothetical protein